MELSKRQEVIIKTLSSSTLKAFKYVETFDDDKYRIYRDSDDFLYFSMENKRIVELELEITGRENNILKCLDNLNSLRLLKIYIGNTKEKILRLNLKIESLHYLYIHIEEEIKISVDFQNLPNLYEFIIQGDDMKNQKINVESIKNIKNLEHLEIVSIRLSQIPEYVKELDKLRNLILRNCGLKKISNYILNNKTLEWLDLRGNNELMIDKETRDFLYEKFSLFNPPNHYLYEDLNSPLKKI
ncbi:hypothetical protein LCGC14_0886720 [marine sediment metagenome]|uniref:Leucine-rich repeat domain-containing protein n=1 Tax=marine sediment metagenome TaxID=412755 RepID=A0A0F9P5B9_9ZZZZ